MPLAVGLDVMELIRRIASTRAASIRPRDVGVFRPLSVWAAQRDTRGTEWMPVFFVFGMACEDAGKDMGLFLRQMFEQEKAMIGPVAALFAVPDTVFLPAELASYSNYGDNGLPVSDTFLAAARTEQYYLREYFDRYAIGAGACWRQQTRAVSLMVGWGVVGHVGLGRSGWGKPCFRSPRSGIPGKSTTLSLVRWRPCHRHGSGGCGRSWVIVGPPQLGLCCAYLPHAPDCP